MLSASRISSAALALLGFVANAASQRVPATTVSSMVNSQTDPHIATDGTNTYVAWDATPHVLMSRSSDGGGTWSAPVGVDQSSSCWASDVEIAVAAGNVFVVWSAAFTCQFPNSPSDQIIRFNRSSSGGVTWLPQDLLISGGQGHAFRPQIAAEGTNVYVVWEDDRNRNIDVYFTRSTDAGATWLPAARLDTDSPGAAISAQPRIAVSAGNVYVTWAEYRNGAPDVYFNRSLDNGVSWLANDVRLDTGVAPGAANVNSPEIAAHEGSVCVIWLDHRHWVSSLFLEFDIYGNASLDGGTTWLATDVRIGPGSTPGTIKCAYAGVARVGSTVHVCWCAARDASSSAWDTFAKRSTDDGVTWPIPETRLHVAGAPGTFTGYSLIRATSDVVAVMWSVGSLDGSGLSCNRSTDGGVTWLPREVRIRTLPPAAGPVFSVLAASGPVIRAAWLEGDTLNQSIASNLPFGFVNYGAAMVGSGGFAPQLSGSGLPTIGGACSIDVGSGLGGAAGALLVGAGPASRVSIPLLGGTLLVNPTLSLTFHLSGATPGSGAWSLPLAVPNVAAFIGIDLNFQALVVDPASPSSIVFTNGLETWID